MELVMGLASWSRDHIKQVIERAYGLFSNGVLVWNWVGVSGGWGCEWWGYRGTNRHIGNGTNWKMELVMGRASRSRDSIKRVIERAHGLFSNGVLVWNWVGVFGGWG
ncbi:hypothetical protein Pyn_01181 [Prunus yedoensis var. nudiflora]|uniref:Uncharacterized protein n=1 Tax=Prunus yedoensis var. nudiflora TaxID=2094558 RepID=A0A314ZUA3_PRUYE|nr:hypothetical protein Pyn_01181 [Prunus yedoensis var. nudiflora]